MPSRLGMVALIGAVVVSACQRDAELPSPVCDVNATAISDSSIGPLHLGEALPALRTRCPAVMDTNVVVAMPGWADTVEAMRMVIVGYPVLAIHANGTVSALRVTAPGFVTSDSLQVGTSIARFRDRLGVRVSRSAHGSAAVLQLREHCGKLFELSGWGSATLPLEGDPPLPGAALVTWPDSIRVVAITISRCLDPSGNTAVDSAFDRREDSIVADSLLRSPLPPTSATTSSIPSTGAGTAIPPVGPAVPAPVVPAPRTTPASPPLDPSRSEVDELKRGLIIPVQGVSRSQLRDTYTEARGSRVHEAIDIIAPRGTPVLSASDGKLMRLFNSKTGGLMVYAADPTDRFVLLYGHLDRYADGLRDGMPLKQGQVIGYVGTTGNAPVSTPHLHFGILRGTPSRNWSRGTPVNPYDLLAR